MQSLRNILSSKTEDWSENQYLIPKLRRSRPTETLQSPITTTEIHGEHSVTVTITEVTPIDGQGSRVWSSFIAPLANFMESLKERCAKKREETPRKERETAKKIIEIEKRRESSRMNKEAEIGGRNEDNAMMPKEDTRKLREDIRKTE
jgi:hypothetical protein